MHTFESKISGIPCQIQVSKHYKGNGYINTGGVLGGYGDCEPDPNEFEFTVLDRKGYKAEWLERKLMPSDHVRLKREYLYFLELL